MILDYNMVYEMCIISEAVEKIRKALVDIGIRLDNSWEVLRGVKGEKDIEIDGLSLSWENINEMVGIETDNISIGLSISTGPICLHGKYIQPPESFELKKAEILEDYLLKELACLEKTINCFSLSYKDNGLEDDYVDGWEHWMGFSLEENEYESKEELINKIMEEEDDIIEFAEIYINPTIANRPPGSWGFMLEFFSAELIYPDDNPERYSGSFGSHDYNGNYIKDCMDIINKVERRAKELEEKYKSYDIKVTIGDFNIGCQYGMSVYVWVPKK